MKNLLQRYLLRRQIRSIAAHLDALDRERANLETSVRYYERKSVVAHTKLLHLQLRSTRHA